MLILLQIVMFIQIFQMQRLLKIVDDMFSQVAAPGAKSDVYFALLSSSSTKIIICLYRTKMKDNAKRASLLSFLQITKQNNVTESNKTKQYNCIKYDMK